MYVNDAGGASVDDLLYLSDGSQVWGAWSQRTTLVFR